MDTLADKLPEEIIRVRELQDLYKSMRGMPQVNVEPAIAMMEDTIRRAVEVSAQGDTVGMLRSYKELQEYEE